jgi:hypothetical protein
MEQSPSWEVDSCTAAQEISLLLYKPKAHYHVLKSLPVDLILTQMNLFRPSILILFSHIDYDKAYNVNWYMLKYMHHLQAYTFCL